VDVCIWGELWYEEPQAPTRSYCTTWNDTQPGPQISNYMYISIRVRLHTSDSMASRANISSRNANCDRRRSADMIM